MPNENEIVKVESKSPNQMIQLAIESNADLDKLEKVLELSERYEANEARKVFASEFAVVQAEIGAVVKTKKNPQTNSSYAGLDEVIGMAKPVYTKQGFSIIYYEGEAKLAEDVRLCADVLHKAGHQKTYHLDVPLGGVGIKGNVNMTKIHAKATSITYARRYLLCMIWNIPTQDDDGNGGGGDKQPPEFPEPTEQEQGCIDAVCEALPDEQGQRVDPVLVAKNIYNLCKKYPDDLKTAKATANFLIERLCQVYVPDQRDDLDRALGLPGDEDSKPDEQKECRWICIKNDHEFDHRKNGKLCPICLSDELLDRQATK